MATIPGKPAEPAGELIGYARVSTEDQDLSLQIAALKAVNCLEIHQEKVSGASKRRPALDLAIKNLRPNDTLVVWRLDRLARSMPELYARLDQIKEQGAGFKSLTESFDLSSPTGRLVLGFMGLMAEFERAVTQQRTRAGLEAARARGVRLGAALKFTETKRIKARKMIAAGKMSRRAIAGTLEISTGTLYRWIKDGMPPVKKQH